MFLTNRYPLTFVVSEKFFDNMETDCDFHLVGLHVTGNQSKIERPATPYWARLAQHIIKVCMSVITLQVQFSLI